uniref:Nuclear receptor 2C2 associated protein n=1 Tax=Crocodylus porosus TaxID=8502 RepID=A0A7M4FE36_CROPO
MAPAPPGRGARPVLRLLSASRRSCRAEQPLGGQAAGSCPYPGPLPRPWGRAGPRPGPSAACLAELVLPSKLEGCFPLLSGCFSPCSDAQLLPGPQLSRAGRLHTRRLGRRHPAAHSSTPFPLGWAALEFPQTVRLSRLQLQFQAGFASRLCTLEGCRKGEELAKILDFYPDDVHALQISFCFPVQGATLDRLRITFARSTDFFGRIVVYHLGVLGQKL